MRASLRFLVVFASFALPALRSGNLPAIQPDPSAVTNPLLTDSTLPYHLPPFAAIKDEHFAPAFEQGAALARFSIRTLFGLTTADCRYSR